MRPIDADALIESLNNSGIEYNATINAIIMSQPTCISPDYRKVVKEVGDRLSHYFSTREPDKAIKDALLTLSYDPYIDVIFFQYRDNITLETIANYMDRDVTTIKRNKKRLILKIYEAIHK